MSNAIEDFYIEMIDLPTLIEKLGIENVLFKIQYGREDKPDYYIICDKNEKQKYDPEYKIYLKSINTLKDKSFYVCDLEEVLLNQGSTNLKAEVFYRHVY